MDFIWVLTVVIVAALALFRWHRFNMMIAKAINGAEEVLGSTFTNILRVVAVVLMLFGIVYFFTSSVQLLIKYAVFERCLPEKPFVTRLASCMVGDPYKHIKSTTGS